LSTIVRFHARPAAPPLGAIFLGIGLLFALAVGILHLDRLPFTICTFKAITGLPCMTCGTTRTLGLLFRGDLAHALSMNPLATVAGIGLTAWGLADLWLLRRHAALGVETAPAARLFLRVTAIVLVAANWAYLISAGR
jgi:hypothetical protein